jgi:hypothetical protein
LAGDLPGNVGLLHNDRPVPVHAFVDESRLGRLYLVAAVMVEPSRLIPLRKVMRALLLPGQHELHFQEREPATPPVSAVVDCD